MSDTVPRTLAEILALPGPLSERLAAYSRLMRAENSPYTAEYDRLVERLAAGGIGADAPTVGERMPPFMLPDAAGRLVSLADLVAEGPLVLSLNRGHWCPFCRIELEGLAAFEAEFAALGARTVSIMPERAEYTAALQGDIGRGLVILSDMGNGYALELGLAMWVGEAVRALMEAEGVRVDRFQGNDGWFVPLPGTFVVGRDGRVAGRFIDPDFRDRMEIEEILSILRALAG